MVELFDDPSFKYCEDKTRNVCFGETHTQKSHMCCCKRVLTLWWHTGWSTPRMCRWTCWSSWWPSAASASAHPSISVARCQSTEAPLSTQEAWSETGRRNAAVHRGNMWQWRADGGSELCCCYLGGLPWIHFTLHRYQLCKWRSDSKFNYWTGSRWRRRTQGSPPRPSWDMILSLPAGFSHHQPNTPDSCRITSSCTTEGFVSTVQYVCFLTM